MASQSDIDLAFKNSGVGRSATSADYQLYGSNPFFSDAGRVEGDLRAGGGGTTYNSYLQDQQQQKTNALAAQQKQAMDQEFANEKQAVSDFSNKYKGDVNNVVNNTSAKYNLPDLANISNALDSRIHELSGNTNNAGAEGMASASQVDQAIQSRYLPQYQQAVSNQSNATQAAQTEENQLLAPDQAEASLLNQRLAQEMSGFTNEQKNELDGLLASMNAGVQLTTAQQQRANELAIAEEGYQNALNQTKLQQQNVVLPPGDTYYNTATGTTYNPYVASTTHG